MSKRKLTVFGALAATLAFAGAAVACDGYHRVEQKNKRYEHITLNKEQKEKISSLKQKAIAQFSEDHKHGGCDEKHALAVKRFVAEADGVLTPAQRMKIESDEKIQKLEQEIQSLKRELAELKRMIKDLAKRR